MRILVVNVGSSSVKPAVIDMPAGEEAFTAELSLRKQEVGGVLAALPMLLDAQGVRVLDAVAHRVTHGADRGAWVSVDTSMGQQAQSRMQITSASRGSQACHAVALCGVIWEETLPFLEPPE